MKKTLTFLVAAAGLLATLQDSRGAVACDRTELGDKIKDNGRIYLSTSHPSGISDAGSTARQNILDTSDGKKARTSGYSDVGVTYVWIHPNLLDCMDRLEGVYGYSYSVSEIAGGDHSSGSYH